MAAEELLASWNDTPTTDGLADPAHSCSSGRSAVSSSGSPSSPPPAAWASGPAVLIGVLLTLFLVLVGLDRMGLTELQPTRDERDVEPAGPGTEAVPGLIILRFDGPLYTANVRSANRKILAAVDDRPGTRVLVLDATAVALVTVTLINEFSVLERELHQRGVTLWVTALPPAARRAAEQRPRWAELAQADRLHPTARSAVESYRAGGGRC